MTQKVEEYVRNYSGILIATSAALLAALGCADASMEARANVMPDEAADVEVEVEGLAGDALDDETSSDGDIDTDTETEDSDVGDAPQADTDTAAHRIDPRIFGVSIKPKLDFTDKSLECGAGIVRGPFRPR